MRCEQTVRLVRGALGAASLIGALVMSSPASAGVALAQDAGRDPNLIVLTNEDAGKSTTVVSEASGAGDRGSYAHRRWLRDRDSEDVGVGPIITDNRVWVAPDVPTAQAIFREEVAKQKEFPESADKHEGPFAFPIAPLALGDEVMALSACIENGCDTRGGINLHERVVVRKDNVVSVVYLFGRERNTTPELTLFFVNRVLERI